MAIKSTPNFVSIFQRKEIAKLRSRELFCVDFQADTHIITGVHNYRARLRRAGV